MFFNKYFGSLGVNQGKNRKKYIFWLEFRCEIYEKLLKKERKIFFYLIWVKNEENKNFFV